MNNSLLYFKAIAFRLIIFSIIWWGFTHNNVGSWAIGVPVVLASVIISLKLIPATHFSPMAFIAFIPYFLRHSFLGGVDVARRVLKKKCDIYPVITYYTCPLPEGIPVFFMLCIINLLPGTLSVTVKEHQLMVHVLNGKSDYTHELVLLLSHVKRIFLINTESQLTIK